MRSLLVAFVMLPMGVSAQPTREECIVAMAEALEISELSTRGAQDIYLALPSVRVDAACNSTDALPIMIICDDQTGVTGIIQTSARCGIGIGPDAFPFVHGPACRDDPRLSLVSGTDHAAVHLVIWRGPFAVAPMRAQYPEPHTATPLSHSNSRNARSSVGTMDRTL